MTDLRDQMHDAVADVSTDLHALTVRSRRRGLAQRRMRRTLATVGSVAATLVIGTAGWAAFSVGSDAGQPVRGREAPVASQAPPRDELVQITGRTAAQLLIDVVGDRVPAVVSNDSIAGQGGVDVVDAAGNVVVPSAENTEVYATLDVRNNTGKSTLGVNVQHWAHLELGTGCELSWVTDCRVEQLPGGDLVRTYRDDAEEAGSIRLIAELISPGRDLRVVVASSSASGSTPAVDFADLRAFATDARWGFDVSQDVAHRADALTSYEWLPQGVATTPPNGVEPPAANVG